MKTQATRQARTAVGVRPPTQPERTAAMRSRLTHAATELLIERGYARTTAVDVCARVGVSRGAFHHHFASLAALYAEALEVLYARLLEEEGPKSRAKDASAAALVDLMWRKTRRREFKAVIEIWLAARNDATLGEELRPRIDKLSTLFSPSHNPRLAHRLTPYAPPAAFYRLVMEAMIGMALGRAVSPSGKPVAHEKGVVQLLKVLASDLARKSA